MSSEIIFDPQIKWCSIYRRNYKEKKSKHVLCFPDHNVNGHRTTEFCGTSIKISVKRPENRNVLIFGNFSLYDDSKSEYCIGDHITKDIFKNNDKRKYPLYNAEERDNQSDSNEYKTYVINPKLKAWTMSDRLYKCSPSYTFRVFMFVETANDGEYECIYSTRSPPFQIISSRKVKTVDDIKETKNEIDSDIPLTLSEIESFPDALPLPDCYSDSSVQISSPSTTSTISEDVDFDNLNESEMRKILKEMKEKSSFKYGHIMPHIYDDGSNSNIGNEYQQVMKQQIPNESKIVIERDAFNFEDMKKTFQDILYSRQSNVIYKINGWLDMDFILPNDNEADKTREEISCVGLDIHRLKHPSEGFEYLDKYGNRFKFISPNQVIKI